MLISISALLFIRKRLYGKPFCRKPLMALQRADTNRLVIHHNFGCPRQSMVVRPAVVQFNDITPAPAAVCSIGTFLLFIPVVSLFEERLLMHPHFLRNGFSCIRTF